MNQTMTSKHLLFSILFLLLPAQGTCFFPGQIPGKQQQQQRLISLHSTLKGIVDGAQDLVEDAVENLENVARREEKKREILQLGASYDRGFGASSRVREKVDRVISELEDLNQETNASRFISPETALVGKDRDSISRSSSPEKNNVSPLTGNWRMVWTTAPDVLILGANPFLTVGAIYQVFEPPVVTNVIDLLPRIQNLVPPSMILGSLLRAKVQTKASPRKGNAMRIGLDFESVSLNPVELLGQSVAKTLPPLGFDLPKLFEVSEDVGFFDVSFLDKELLVIRQNAPGGLFVFVKVDDADP
jgi:hypothetical protein